MLPAPPQGPPCKVGTFDLTNTGQHRARGAASDFGERQLAATPARRACSPAQGHGARAPHRPVSWLEEAIRELANPRPVRGKPALDRFDLGRVEAPARDVAVEMVGGVHGR
jgi:hypothetical protein